MSCYKNRPQYPEEEKGKNSVNINTSVSITQSAEANGGSGGNGGNGGSATGGSAASASASGEDASASATASSGTGGGLNGTDDLAQNPADVEADPEASTSTAVGGTATGGAGGEGGNGGIGGTASNSASVTIDNVIMISYNGTGPDTAIKLGMNERKVDITVDKDGNTFVNGKKMDEEELENGTKVFIFRNSESKKTEAIAE